MRKKPFTYLVLITAAGRGKRMGVLTRTNNKSLFLINNTPLISHIINVFKKFKFEKIFVVTGYQSEKVVKVIGNEANCVFNASYLNSGILVSIQKVRSKLQGKSFIFSPGDHFFKSNVVESLLNTSGDIRIVIQKKEEYSKDDAKVIIKNAKIIEMGKNIPEAHAMGEFTGMAYFSEKVSKIFFKEIEDLIKNGFVNAYVMDVIIRMNQKYSFPINYSYCKENSRIEIDSVSDLIHARKIAKNFTI